jgi:hypothetical protein
MKGRFYRTARLHVLLKTLLQSVVIIPKAMEYAMIAGLPVQVGLYTALVPMAIYAVLGTSRRLSVSTTTTLAVLTAAQLGQVVPTGDPTALLRASATLALLVGAALVLACLLRLGFVANFISEPVLVGFRAGIGLVIVVDQIPKILGIHFSRGTFVHNVLSTVHNIPKNVVSYAGHRRYDNRVSAEHGAFHAEGASAADGCNCRNRDCILAESAGAGRRTGGPYTAGTAFTGEARPLLGDHPMAWSAGNCFDEFHGDACGRQSFRAK